MRAARPVRSLRTFPPISSRRSISGSRSISRSPRIPTGRPLNYGGAAPAGWERRLQPRMFSGSSVGGPFGSSSPGNKLPWSLTHLPDVEDGE